MSEKGEVFVTTDAKYFMQAFAAIQLASFGHGSPQEFVPACELHRLNCVFILAGQHHEDGQSSRRCRNRKAVQGFRLGFQPQEASNRKIFSPDEGAGVLRLIPRGPQWNPPKNSDLPIEHGVCLPGHGEVRPALLRSLNRA